jgi:hypothetical protein
VSTEDILVEVFRERVRQELAHLDGKHPIRIADPYTHNGFRTAVLLEEVGEVAHEVNEMLGEQAKHGNWSRQRETNLKKELIQVAAVAVAWVRGLENEDESHAPPSMPLTYTNRDLGSVAVS